MVDRSGFLSNILGVLAPLYYGRYLGLPSMVGRSKKLVLKHFRERLWERVNAWRGKFLSKASYEVLIKTVD